MISCSATSLAFGIYPLALMLFNSKRIVRYRYLSLVCLILISDIAVCLGGICGGQKRGTPGCVFQYVTTNYFPVYSCLLSIIVMRELYYTICLGKILPASEYTIFHISAALIPLICTFVPLSTVDIGPTIVNNDRYGDDQGDGFNGHGWCYLIPRDGTPDWLYSFWIIAGFYVWIWISILYMAGLCVLLYFHIKSISSKALREHSRLSLYKLLCYPIVLPICWVIPAYYDIMLALQPHDSAAEDGRVLFLDFGLPFLIGAGTSIAFMVTNRNLVYGWTVEVLEYWQLITVSNKWSEDSHFDHTSIPPLIEDEDDRTTEMASRGTTNTSNVTLASLDVERESSYGKTWKNSSTHTSRNNSIVKNPINQ